MVTSSPSPLQSFPLIRAIIFSFLVYSYATVQLTECYTSMFNFGDSITDTGNFLYILGDTPTNIGKLPYGETFFHHPTGRFSDGRLVVDFIAESLQIPILPPYLPSRGKEDDLRQGANFAVSGSTALDVTFLAEQGIQPVTNYSLGAQIEWFKDYLPSLCHNKTDCKKALNQSLFMVSMEGNDYNYALQGGSNKLLELLPPMVAFIASSVKVLIELGATSIAASGMLPIGCLTATVLSYRPEEEKQLGCVSWINDVVKNHNLELQRELGKIRELHPDVNIFYADFYNATIPIYQSPTQFAFTNGPFSVCCENCAFGEVKKSCADPSTYVSWDGVHLTEAAYEVMAEAVLKGSCNFTITDSCPYDNVQGLLNEPAAAAGGKAKVQ